MGNEQRRLGGSLRLAERERHQAVQLPSGARLGIVARARRASAIATANALQRPLDHLERRNRQGRHQQQGCLPRGIGHDVGSFSSSVLMSSATGSAAGVGWRRGSGG